MKKEIVIPEGVDIRVSEMEVAVKGPKGEIIFDFDNPRFNSFIKIEKADKLAVVSSSEKRLIKAMAGTIIAKVNNMITGVTKGYEYKMKILYSHFPINVDVKDGKVYIKNFLGAKAPRITSVTGRSEVRVDKETVIIRGIDIEEVGQTCLNIEQVCKINQKDGRIFNDGIYITDKGVQGGSNE